ncbi:bifunctional DNA-binding transcriptional regulator/O6-methylguanine-DNA methyltransferase Ada [Duganella callida]|uniref:methylated-DNA--[protein]-cysteine S-methyltransferase n=1 Tax=Duganella callida TaxID=2561932 RepID=A0A4Y9S385_9BURK|nr:bifunctional DNA-binding transcriptional regulator/O6-methylguanine-DNA methyltransferase Ada [Duganella callida]TFW15802.1 bifunctional DNA-binding transcriptional regulator/O6-methylguanine-DNA methyltransferase Ada [Duganella callida]
MQRGKTADDPRWHAIVARDQNADGTFWYSVSSTRVYCRPSCPSRTAHPRYVQIHDTLAQARATGYRPCLRCHPDQPSVHAINRDIVVRACQLIASSEHELPLEALAVTFHRSPSHFHRLFKATVGITPKAYHQACRAQRLQQQLHGGASITQAYYAAGFESSAQFYEAAPRLLGMAPTRYRSGGQRERIHFALGQCSLGVIAVASTSVGVAAILLGDDPEVVLRDVQDRFPKAELVGGDRQFEALVATVVGMIENPCIPVNLPLDIRGTAFQQKVWQILSSVPPGATITYAEIARQLGTPRATRAVAAACAANPLAVAIPCHRVVRNDGTYWGYTWGLERKQALLSREARGQT